MALSSLVRNPFTETDVLIMVSAHPLEKMEKVVELVGGGTVFNGAYPV